MPAEKEQKQQKRQIWISGFWANGVARPTGNQKLSPFGGVLQPVGFYDPISRCAMRGALLITRRCGARYKNHRVYPRPGGVRFGVPCLTGGGAFGRGTAPPSSLRGRGIANLQYMHIDEALSSTVESLPLKALAQMLEPLTLTVPQKAKALAQLHGLTRLNLAAAQRGRGISTCRCGAGYKYRRAHPRPSGVRFGVLHLIGGGIFPTLPPPRGGSRT